MVVGGALRRCVAESVCGQALGAGVKLMFVLMRSLCLAHAANVVRRLALSINGFFCLIFCSGGGCTPRTSTTGQLEHLGSQVIGVAGSMAQHMQRPDC